MGKITFFLLFDASISIFIGNQVIYFDVFKRFSIETVDNYDILDYVYRHIPPWWEWCSWFLIGQITRKLVIIVLYCMQAWLYVLEIKNFGSKIRNMTLQCIRRWNEH